MNSFLKNLIDNPNVIGSTALDKYEKELAITGIFKRSIYECVDVLLPANENLSLSEVFEDLYGKLSARVEEETDKLEIEMAMPKVCGVDSGGEERFRIMIDAINEMVDKEPDHLYIAVSVPTVEDTFSFIVAVSIKNDAVADVVFSA